MPHRGVRSNLAKSLDRSLIVVLCAGVVLAAIEAALLPLRGPAGHILVLFPLVVLAYFGAGVRAWYRRPGNRFGVLIVAGGFAVFLGGLANTGIPLLVAAGCVGATLVLAVMVHLLHAFPSGRVHGRISKVTVMAAYVNSLLLQSPSYLFTHDGPAPFLVIAHYPDLAAGTDRLQQWLGTAVMLATAFVLLRRLRQADGERRKVLRPLFAYGAFAVLFVPFGAGVLVPLLGIAPEELLGLQLLVIGGIPLAFSHGILRGGFAKTGELEELGSWLGASGGARSALAGALSRTLGDPSLGLSFWVPKRGVFVNEEGAPIAPLLADSGRGQVEIELGGRTVGAIHYDASLIEAAELVRTAGQVVAIAVDRERLSAELRESHGALQRSRERLVDAADRERRRIAQDLHDGLQMHLVLLALEAQQLANAPGVDAATKTRATALRQGIDSAAADLRQLVHDVMPAALIERGLVAAAEDLADRMPITTSLELDVDGQSCPSAVESTAYFVLAEALTNTMKHAHARRAWVGLTIKDGWLRLEINDDGVGGASLNDGKGLRGVADRVDVLNGYFILVSEPGAGTALVVELPCE
ncbi:sensor histidine kinase [Arthrobacter sp. HLT1-20]